MKREHERGFDGSKAVRQCDRAAIEIMAKASERGGMMPLAHAAMYLWDRLGYIEQKKLARLRHDAENGATLPARLTPQEAVEQGGGVFVGLQDCEGIMPDFYIFNDPATGSTLSFPASTPVASIAQVVRERIEAAK